MRTLAANQCPRLQLTFRILALDTRIENGAVRSVLDLLKLRTTPEIVFASKPDHHACMALGVVTPHEDVIAYGRQTDDSKRLANHVDKTSSQLFSKLRVRFNQSLRELR